MEKLPLLYSFRRCPYAMRARIALAIARINVEVREISLKEKPDVFLTTSAKGTVPVLVLPEGQVIDESLDIIAWVQQQCTDWSFEINHPLIVDNDTVFVTHARKYKYFENYPEASQASYRDQSLFYIEKIEEQLAQSPFILGDTPSFVDIALFPFMRQFGMVDEAWFEASPYKALKIWLSYWLKNEAYEIAMRKWPEWKEGDKPVMLFDSE